MEETILEKIEKISIDAEKLKQICQVAIQADEKSEMQGLLYIMLDYINIIIEICNV